MRSKTLLIGLIGIVIGAGSFYLGIPLLAFAGALATVFIVFMMAGKTRGALLDHSLVLSGVVVNALNEMRNDLIKEERPTDAVDELLLKTIDAPTKKVKRRNHDEAR